jgi:hypothetical protein
MYMLIPIGLHKDSSKYLETVAGIQRKRFILDVLAPAITASSLVVLLVQPLRSAIYK